ncbi:hypothetical protein K1719_036457 [Acacia pycnantha]|nr:hypothetical protein K1719_036457 [Acacia pycnantha]
MDHGSTFSNKVKMGCIRNKSSLSLVNHFKLGYYIHLDTRKGNVWCLYPNKNAAVKSVQDAFGQELLENYEAVLAKRMKELVANESSADGKMLRLGVETGGCSGFQYVFYLDDRRRS